MAERAVRERGVSIRMACEIFQVSQACYRYAPQASAENEEIVQWLRQRSRPYLFSNSLAPAITATTVRALALLQESHALQQHLERNAHRFRAAMEAAGFTLAGAGHPIIPVMLGDAKVAGEMAQRLLAEGIYVIAFSFPVVPQGKARIRTQMSAAHSDADIDRAIAAFVEVGREMGVVS